MPVSAPPPEGGGRIFTTSGVSHPPPGDGSKKKKKGGGGFLDSVGGFASRFGDDIYHAAVDSPAGLYEVAKAGGHDTAAGVAAMVQAVTGKEDPFGLAEDKPESPQLAKALKDQTIYDLTHPSEHPGNFALTAGGLAALGVGTAARVGAAGRALRAGESVSEAVAAVSEPKSLVMRASNGKVAKRPAPRSALWRQVSSMINDLQNRFPDSRVPPFRSQNKKVGAQLARARQTDFKVRTAPHHALTYRGRKIGKNSPEGMAIRAYADNTPLETMRAAFERDLATAKTKYEKTLLKKQIALTEKAAPLVTVDHLGHTQITDPKLAAFAKEMESHSLELDKRQVDLGMAEPELLAEAMHKPGRAYRGDDTWSGARFHIGYQYRNKPFSIRREPAAGNPYTVNAGRPLPSRLTHELTGAAQRQGRIRHDVARLEGEKALEAERHAAIIEAVQSHWQDAQDTPIGIKHPVAIKAEELYGKALPEFVKDLQDAYKEGRQLNQNETSLFGLVYEPIRQMVFPKLDPKKWAPDIPKYKGVRWIERDLLGGLNEPNPLASLLATSGGRRLFSFIDTTNNGAKLAYLYLRPAYVLPNLFGNFFLTITQQGWAAPKNVAQAVRMMKRLGPDDTILVDSMIGEGINAQLASEGGVGAKVMNAFSSGYGKVIDVPFRRAAFIYEARRELGRGAKWQEIRSLLHDEKMRSQLDAVRERANRALIEYGELSPVERAIIRRVLFFYPWLKGSTRYAKDYLSNHPQQAALLGQLGQYGYEQATEDLGARPSWGQGMFKVGGSDNFPLTVNPASSAILGQPAQLGAILANTVAGHVKPGYAAKSILTPFVGGVGASVFGVDDFGKPIEPNAQSFVKSLYESSPEYNLYKRLTEDQSGKTFPVTTPQALSQFLLAGSLTPRTTNKAKYNDSAVRERRPAG